MGDVPVLKPREVAGILERLGFVEVRQRGPTGSIATPTAALPPFRFTQAGTCHLHAGRDMSPTLLRVNARDIGMDVRDFVGRR